MLSSESSSSCLNGRIAYKYLNSLEPDNNIYTYSNNANTGNNEKDSSFTKYINNNISIKSVNCSNNKTTSNNLQNRNLNNINNNIIRTSNEFNSNLNSNSFINQTFGENIMNRNNTKIDQSSSTMTENLKISTDFNNEDLTTKDGFNSKINKLLMQINTIKTNFISDMNNIENKLENILKIN